MIKRARALLLALVAASCSPAPAPVPPPEPAPVLPVADTPREPPQPRHLRLLGEGPVGDDPSALHHGSFVVDLHADTPWFLQKHPDPGALARAEAGPEALRRGGVDAQFYVLWVRPGTPHPRARAWNSLAQIQDRILVADPAMALVQNLDQLLDVGAHGGRAALLGMEGAGPLEGDLEALDAFAAAGVSYLSLTWNPANEWGGGATGDPAIGATELGLELVDRLNTLRVVPDISHASYSTFWDVVTRSERPVIASHSNARAILDHPRNLDDAQLWAIAESGGVVGLNFHGPFIHGERRGARMDELLRHVDHLRAVLGPEHLALGSDFDGTITVPVDLPNAAALPALTVALRARDYGGELIRGLLGGNVLRVLEETWDGTERPAPTHRPATVLSASADQGGDVAGFAVDRNTATAWSVGSWTGTTPPVLSFEVEGPGIDRIAVSTAGPSRPSRVRGVSILAQSVDGSWSHTARLEPPPTVRPHRAALPGAECLDRIVIHVLVDELFPGGGDVSIAEVMPERRDVDCPETVSID